MLPDEQPQAQPVLQSQPQIQPQPHPTHSRPGKKGSKLSTDCPACLAGPDYISRLLIDVFNNREYDHPLLSHISPNMHSEHEYNEARTLAEFIETHRRITAVYPEYRTRVTDSTGDVDEVAGKAKIWLTLQVIGYPKDMKREGISVLYWRIKGGEWSHYRNRGIVAGGSSDSDWP